MVLLKQLYEKHIYIYKVVIIDTMKQYKSHNSNEGVHSLEAIISKKKKKKTKE
jgi:hypothetical protein